MMPLLLVLTALAQVPAGRSALTFADVLNVTFDFGDSSSVEGGKVRLANGKWTDPAAGGNTFTLMPEHAIGDLNGDRVADAAIVIAEGTPGDAAFYYLFALVNQNGKFVQAGPPEWLGDRSRIERVSIDRSGVLTVRYVTHKDGDPACCPTLRIEDSYRLQNGKLVGILK